MRLDRTDRKLQAYLAGAAATTNPTVTVAYRDIPNQEKNDYSEYRGANQFTVLAGTTETDVCAAPLINGTVREIDYISIYNTDTATVTVTVSIDDAATNRIQAKIVLLTGEAAVWSAKSGDWMIVS